MTSARFPLVETVHATRIEWAAPVISYPMETTNTRQYRQIFWGHPSLNHSSPPLLLIPHPPQTRYRPKITIYFHFTVTTDLHISVCRLHRALYNSILKSHLSRQSLHLRHSRIQHCYCINESSRCDHNRQRRHNVLAMNAFSLRYFYSILCAISIPS